MRYFFFVLCVASSLFVTAQQAPVTQTLTIQQAEDIALRNNPQITAAKLTALAQGQVTREARAAEMPTLGMDVTAITANNGTRLTAGGLNNPVVYERAAAGITATQLITDFGRTQQLVRSAQLRADAETQNSLATAAQVRLAVDSAFYEALAAQSVEEVAKQTVATRQSVLDRITALTNAHLKSTLDESFAQVAVSQAQLLLVDARNHHAATLNTLNALLGNELPTQFTLIDNMPSAPPLPPAEAEPLVAQALQVRPEVLAASDSAQAAKRFSRAESKLSLPTISAMGATGATPVRADQITTNWYGAVGANIHIPLFNGFLYSSRAKEADLQAQAASQKLAQVRQLIARDVRQTVLQTQSNFQSIAVTQQLYNQATQAQDLAETRYKLGLSSIVELSQAQLAATEAQIRYANARYTYQQSLAALRFVTGQ